MKKLIAFLLTLVMVFSMTACGGKTDDTTKAPDATEGQKTYNLSVAGTSASSGYYALNVAVCNVINSYVDGVTVTLMETGGTVDDYKLMRGKEASFGQTADMTEYMIQNGLGSYDGFGYTNTYDLCFFVPQAYRFVVSKDSGIKTIAELKGKKYNAGLAGSAAESDTMAMLGELGIEPNWYPASTAEAVDAISNRQIIGFTKSCSNLAADSTIANLMSSIDVEFLSFTDEEIAKIQAKYPYYGFDEVTCEMYGKDYKTKLPCMNLGFCVDGDLPDDVVYNIIKAIHEHLEEIRAAFPGMAEDPLAVTASDVASSKIHPGVVRYLEEHGYKVKDARKK